MSDRRQSAHDRWFFYAAETGQFICTIEHPTSHPGFRGWERKYNKDGCVVSEYPVVVLDGRTLWGSALHATQNDTIACSSSCITAKEPACSCACGGKNHGLASVVPQEELAES